MANTWLEYTDSDYNSWIHKWRYTKLVDSLEYTDKDNIEDFLIKRAHWEKKEQLKARINAADPNMDFSLLMGKIVGMALTTEDDDIREFEKDGTTGLGHTDQEDTPIGKLWYNADGEGTNYPVLWRKYLRNQLIYHWMYVLVDGLEDEVIYDADGNVIETKTKEASIKLITPDMVLAKDQSPGLPSWIKVKHRMEVSGADWTTKSEQKDYYTIYSLDGWERYCLSDDGKSEVLVASSTYKFYTNKEKEQERLPIFLVKLPFPYYIAHYLAKKSISIFNQESQRDSYIGNADIHFVDEGAPAEFESRS